MKYEIRNKVDVILNLVQNLSNDWIPDRAGNDSKVLLTEGVK